MWKYKYKCLVVETEVEDPDEGPITIRKPEYVPTGIFIVRYDSEYCYIYTNNEMVGPELISTNVSGDV